VAPQGVLFTPLRQNQIELAREFVALGVDVGEEGLAGVLCDTTSHGATGAALLLMDEMKVPIGALNARDHTNCTDRAIAWHRWETAEVLVMQRGGSPSKLSSALGHLLDSSSDQRVFRMLEALTAKGVFCSSTVMTQVIQRGDHALCEKLFFKSPSVSKINDFIKSTCKNFVDLALCHGHLRLALTLLQHGARAKDAGRARADVMLYGSADHSVLHEILSFLPETPQNNVQNLKLRRAPTACGEEMRNGASNNFLSSVPEYEGRDILQSLAIVLPQ